MTLHTEQIQKAGGHKIICRYSTCIFTYYINAGIHQNSCSFIWYSALIFPCWCHNMTPADQQYLTEVASPRDITMGIHSKPRNNCPIWKVPLPNITICHIGPMNLFTTHGVDKFCVTHKGVIKLSSNICNGYNIPR